MSLWQPSVGLERLYVATALTLVVALGRSGSIRLVNPPATHHMQGMKRRVTGVQKETNLRKFSPSQNGSSASLRLAVCLLGSGLWAVNWVTFNEWVEF